MTRWSPSSGRTRRSRGSFPRTTPGPPSTRPGLGELIDLIGTIELVYRRDSDLFDPKNDHRSKDLLGRVYEYFLGKFANAEGKLGGEFYTPRSVVRLLVEMIERYKGRVFDPCCGSGGMFVQSETFVEAHGGRRSDLSIYGQESNPTTWKLARMNLAIRGIEGQPRAPQRRQLPRRSAQGLEGRPSSWPTRRST